MDLKRVGWAGNIYQKFEALCLEVEEAMYEDTLKYVENQVDKVGVSMKKFYAEVMDDLVTPCVDPLKADSELSLNYHSSANKKTKLNKLDVANKTYDSDLPTGKQSAYNDVNNQSCKVFVETTCSEVFSSKNKKIGIQRRPIGIKRISQTNRPPKVSPSKATTISGDVSGKLVHDKKSSSDDINVPSPSDFVARLDSGEAVAERIIIHEASIESTSSKEKSSAQPRQNFENSECDSTCPDKGSPFEPTRQDFENSEYELTCPNKVLPVEPTGQNTDGSKCNLLPSEESLSDKSASQEKDDLNSTLSSHGLLTQCVLLTNTLLSESALSNEGEIELVEKEVTEDNFDDMEMIDNEEIMEQRSEMFHVDGNFKLDESCVFVEGNQHFVEGIKKHKSYKKKLREALSSKLMPGRRLKDTGGEIKADIAQDCDESDWELL